MSALGDIYQPPARKVRNMQTWRERRRPHAERETTDSGARHVMQRAYPPPARTCQWVLARTPYPEVALFCDAPSLRGCSYCRVHVARVFLTADSLGFASEGDCAERHRVRCGPGQASDG